ncbi:MAG: serine/threonine-protein phosphatase [Gemmataceae bacterium]|nr:serine/threonine-protein phosphatase [Gemmataceae bacterium]
MADFVLHVGSRSAQGVRPNNEDRFVVDLATRLFLVADGMGGQEHGERASGLAADIIPRVVQNELAADPNANNAIQRALSEANAAIVEAGREQPLGRRMGTTAVLALQNNDRVYVAGLGDSRAYLVRKGQVTQLTVDHSVAQALVLNGALTPEEARCSPLQHMLHRFLGAPDSFEHADIHPFEPQIGDRLLLASDGLTNHITEDDLREGPQRFPNAQDWADHLVDLALRRGSRDNVTCVIIAFDQP